jgi:hypothetical protein
MNIPIDETTLHTWFERDRAHVELRHTATERTIVEWWDEAVAEAQENGFLPRVCFCHCQHNQCSLHEAVYEYAEEREMLTA